MKKARGISIAILVIAITVITFLVASRFKTTAQQEAEASPPPASIVTAQITQQKIVDSIPVLCKVSYEQATDLLPAQTLASNAQYTSIDVVEGETLRQGTLVAEINGAPIFIGIGPFSFYRDLKVGDTGPDARMLNTILTELGYQYGGTTADADTFDSTSLAALGLLYASFDYPKPTQDEGFTAASFIILKSPQTVISAPRDTGTVGDTPIASISNNSQQVTCTGLTGSLSPEITVGQTVVLHPAQGDTEAKISALTSPTNNAKTSPEGSQNLPADTSSEKKTIMLQGVPEIPSDTAQISADVIISESSGAKPVVPSAALWTKDSQTMITVISNGQETSLPVKVLYSAQGFNEIEALDATLTVGDEVKLITGAGSQ